MTKINEEKALKDFENFMIEKGFYGLSGDEEIIIELFIKWFNGEKI